MFKGSVTLVTAEDSQKVCKCMSLCLCTYACLCHCCVYVCVSICTLSHATCTSSVVYTHPCALHCPFSHSCLTPSSDGWRQTACRMWCEQQVVFMPCLPTCPDTGVGPITVVCKAGHRCRDRVVMRRSFFFTCAAL